MVETANAKLTMEEARNQQGCGMGTESACFSLVMGPGGLQCGLLANPQVAQMAGIRLGWRVNVDEADQKAWCPKGVLNNSKVAPTA